VRELNACINDRMVGVLSEQEDIWTWTYDPEWARDPSAFDLSPKLPRSQGTIVDGASERQVQWYFDNLLPEEALRPLYAHEARLPAEDAFGLLAWYGAESAGSLVLLAPGQANPAGAGTRPLSDGALSARIRDLPRVPLIHNAPKRMSIAGAQQKLLVVLDGNDLYEPLPGNASTHILKPDHAESAYPHTVINEYFTMVLAGMCGLDVPNVARRYVPEPVYIVQRFDRVQDGGVVRRKHAIDSCQLLGRSRTFKYSAATVESLSAIADACRSPAAARLSLYRWLAFNLLVGNGDNHLKNISALVSAEGIEIAPAYDLVSTAAYGTKAFSERPSWPGVELALPLPGASSFGEVSKATVFRAADAMRMPASIAQRELARMVTRFADAAPTLLAKIEAENAATNDAAKPSLAGELRLLRAMTRIVIADMVRRLR